MKKYTNCPTREELYRLYVEEFKTAKQIADIYNVSETLVFDWMQSYRIDRRSSQSAQLKDKIVPTAEQLHKMYIDDVDTLSTIGDRYDVGPRTVSRWLDKAHIKRRSLSESQMGGKCRPIRDELYRLYVDEFLGMSEVGEMFGCPPGTVYRWLVADGIPTRSMGVTRRGSERPNKEVLYQMHVKDRKTLVEIADMFDTNRTTVRNWLRDADIEFMPIAPSNGIRKKSYCNLWTESFRESIRDKFGRMCFLCGKTEEDNGAKLSVHHTNYGKSCMCSYDCKFVPLCKKCHGKTNGDRFYWYSLIMRKLLLVSSFEYVIMELNI